jgi:hypothetical protein
LGFSVGRAVPAGYYDHAKAAWIASDNGRIIKIIGVTTGRANWTSPATAWWMMQLLLG